MQTAFQVVLTILFTAVLIEGFIVLTLFLYRTSKDFFKPKPGSNEDKKETTPPV